MNRRDFLKTAGLMGGGLVMGITLTGCATSRASDIGPNKEGFSADAFLQITPDGDLHFVLPRTEMGQGVYEGLTSLVAEELDVDPDAIIVHQAPVNKAYRLPGTPVQITGASISLKSHYLPLRQAGANARESLRQAAARVQKVPLSAVTAANGHIVIDSQQWHYGDFAAAAAEKPVVTDAPLKQDQDFRVIGKERSRKDAWQKVTGTAEFGIDIETDNLHRAVLRRCPAHGGKVISFTAPAADAYPGEYRIVEIYNGVAVIAKNYWLARQVADALDIEWDYPDHVDYSSPRIRQEIEEGLNKQDGLKAHHTGKGADALGTASLQHEATYWVPYLAHATMEPMNCTVRIENGECDVWVGCQTPQSAHGLAAHYADLPRDKVRVHTPFLGGGFGRRLTADYVAEATAIAKASGLPVQLVWSREDDMQHDPYRPATMMRMRGGLDDKGQLQTLVAERAGSNITSYFMDEVFESLAPEFMPWGMSDWMSKKFGFFFENVKTSSAAIQGLYGQYDVGNEEVRDTTVDCGIPTGYWRSVGHSCNGFFVESFMDELAVKGGIDPLAFRLGQVAHDPRQQAVLQRLAKETGWGQQAPGQFQGIALHIAFGTIVGQVVELSLDDNGSPVINRVVCAVDCGKVVSPDIIRAQMEGGIIFGLTAALYGEITIENGAAEQGNFDSYPMLTIDQVPQIDVHIMDSDADPTGVGEVAVPPIAPALTNAIFAATGNRIRELPVSNHFDL